KGLTEKRKKFIDVRAFPNQTVCDIGALSPIAQKNKACSVGSGLNTVHLGKNRYISVIANKK
ncbi:MAG TPA: hypothetical protein VGP12_02045, partial [Nitrosospira sp.]|nr:hypothetical protein [Nitrosospira sp.]